MATKMTDLIPSNDRQIRGANIFLEKNQKGITGKNPSNIVLNISDTY